MSKILHILLFVALFPRFVLAQDGKDSLLQSKHSFVVGLRAQKAVGFYWSNGISAEYASEEIFKKSLAFGLTYISSSLGTAAFSYAIPCYEFNGSVIKYFRMRKALKTDLRLNAGYAHADYGSDIYKNLPNQSMTFSLEFDVIYDFKIPLRLAVGGGFNAITGNGMKGLATLYPLYGQFSVLYRIATN